MDLQEAQKYVMLYANGIKDTFNKVPGSAMVARYIRSSYQNDPFRSAMELVLVIFFVVYLLRPQYATHSPNFVKLSEEEIDELIDDWTPEPLAAPLTAFEEAEMEKLPVIAGPAGPKTKLANGKTVMNLASYNFYNLSTNDRIKESAVSTLRKYGVGPCGPPLFYGTQDVHMKTEAAIASCLGTEACVIYANAFSTITSVIPSFCKRGDIIVADEAANFSIRKGCQISRSTIRYYKHNNMEDLERVLQKVVKEQAKKPLTRRFIVTEGLSETVGDCTDLPKLIELKLRYKFRLMLDETWSFGVLGATGRGLTEHQNVDATQIDMLVGSMAGPLCAGGGFCVGSMDVVSHQRVTSTAYTYSAALPAMLATTATETLEMIQTTPELIVQCRENIKAMRAQLDPRSDWVQCTSSPENPIMLLVLKPQVVASKSMTLQEQERVLQECVDESLANGVLITRLKSMPAAACSNGKDDPWPWKLQPAIKVCITTGLSKKEIESAGIKIRHAITKVLTKKTSSKLSLPGALTG